MNFTEALRRAKRGARNVVIPDIKCFSPKDGDLLRGREPAEVARALVRAGAPVLSVVTEELEFHGSLDILREVRRAVDVPILRKDFVKSRRDLTETLDAGADAVLLMYSTLGREALDGLYREALSLGITPFVETHTEHELEWAAELGAELVGINNRDILRLERDDGTVERTKRLMTHAPKGAFLVTESSIKNGCEVREAIRAGADAALVGTAILTSPDPEEAYRALSCLTALKVCGVTDLEGVELCRRHAVDIVGFVTEYPEPVPWDISPETAAPLIESARAFCETAIVTGGSAEKVVSLARRLRPDYVQLHHREDLALTDGIAHELKALGVGTIRSVPPSHESRKEMFGTDDLREIVRLLNGTAVDAVLLDSREASNAASGGGSVGAAFGDISEVLGISEKPVILGGGVTSENAPELVRRFSPDCLDVMTGVETSPGRKSREKLEALAKAIRR